MSRMRAVLLKNKDCLFDYTSAEIRTGAVCDYCTDKMRYAGANFTWHVVRACVKHLEQARQALKTERAALLPQSDIGGAESSDARSSND